jgi:hypothetical protein
MRRTTFLAALLACATAHAEPLAVYSAPSSGFVDDAFAIRDDGKAIAYVITDGATSATLRIAELGGLQSEVAGLPTTVNALHWLGPDRVLVVARDADRQTVTAQVYTAHGPGKEKLGPVDAIALATVSGKPAIVTYARVEKRGIDHVLAAYDRATLKPIAKKSLHADPETGIKHPQGPFKPLWWHDGYTTVATLKAGEFDKARDMRRPDRFAQLEPFTGKLHDEHELEDVLAFTRIATTHQSHPGEDAFVHFSEDQRALLLTDGTAENDVKLERALWFYDPASLAWETLDADRVALSLTVDPVNPDALKRKKADPDDLEIYFVDRKSHAAKLALKLAGQGRPSAWHIGGGRIVVLRKHKGFPRGGMALEVYELPH